MVKRVRVVRVRVKRGVVRDKGVRVKGLGLEGLGLVLKGCCSRVNRPSVGERDTHRGSCHGAGVVLPSTHPLPSACMCVCMGQGHRELV